MDEAPKIKPPSWAFWLLVGMIGLYALWGLAGLPFHPDESTYLFTSADFNLLITQPAAMAWDPALAADMRQHYRLLDAPLTRYLLGVGRSLAGLPAPDADWNWEASWEDNQKAGAVPKTRLLLTGRLTITLLLPIGLFFIYLTGRRMSGEACGLLATLLMGSNALILLHTRRAMAEGALTFGVVIALWCFLEGERKPWLAGLGMALAFNAKHSALALLPVGLMAVGWGLFMPRQAAFGKLLQKALMQMVIFGAVFGIVTWALNPFLWRHPLGAVQASLEGRNALLQRQVADTLRLAPEKAMMTAGERAVSLLANLYVLPPAFSEANNYQAQTAAAETAYLAMPGHSLLRGLAGGGLMLTLTLFGLALALIGLRRAAPEQRKALILTMLATISQAAALIALVPLTWQRYVIPITPLVCLWAAYGLAQLFTKSASIRAQHATA